MLGAHNVGAVPGRSQMADKPDSLKNYLKEGLKRGKGGGGGQRGNKDETAKANKSTTPTSISLINEMTEPKDILENFAEKLAGSKHFKEQVEYRQQVQSRLNADVEKLFKQEFEDKSSDTVVLSASTAVFNKDEIKRASSKAKDVFQEMGSKDPQDETVLDRIEKRLSNGSRPMSPAASSGQLQQSGMAEGTKSADRDARIHETMRQYVSAFSEDLIQQSPGKKQEVAELRERLQMYGVSNKRLSEVQSRVSSFVRCDLKEKIKKGFAQFALSYSDKLTPELLASSKQYKVLEEMGLDTGILADEEDLRSLKDQSKRELGAFVADELDHTLIREKTKGAPFKDLVAAFNKFNELAAVVKFDAGTYMKELGKKMDNLGLSHFVPPEATRGQMDTDARGQGRGGQPQSLELDPDVMTDQLRRLVIQRAIRTDILGSIEVRYKIARLRGKLKKGGGITDIELSDIEREGEALAKIKLIDLLRESLEERAALPALEGPAFDLLRAKLKKALRGLKRLNASVPKDEFNGMRDQINRGMFSVVKEEFLKIDAILENAPSNKALSQKRKQLLGILQRLRKESSIAEDVKPDQSRRAVDSSDGAIVEAA